MEFFIEERGTLSFSCTPPRVTVVIRPFGIPATDVQFSPPPSPRSTDSSSSSSVTSPAIGLVHYSGELALVPYSPSSSDDDDDQRPLLVGSWSDFYFVERLADYQLPIDPENLDFWNNFITHFAPRLREENPNIKPEHLKFAFFSIRRWYWTAQGKWRASFTDLESNLFKACQYLWG